MPASSFATQRGMIIEIRPTLGAGTCHVFGLWPQSLFPHRNTHTHTKYTHTHTHTHTQNTHTHCYWQYFRIAMAVPGAVGIFFCVWVAVLALLATRNPTGCLSVTFYRFAVNVRRQTGIARVAARVVKTAATNCFHPVPGRRTINSISGGLASQVYERRRRVC